MPEGFRYSLAASPFADRMFEAGYTFTDGDRTATNVRELQELCVARGGTEVIAWIGTERHTWPRQETDSSLDAALGRAKLAASLDLPFNPMFFLCRLYADMPGQPAPRFDDYPEISLPGPWETLDIDEMAAVLRRYAAIVARETLETGAHVNVWDLGQEVDLGIAGVFPSPAYAFRGNGGSDMPSDHSTDFDGGDWYRAPDGVDPRIGATNIIELLTMPLDDRIAWCDELLWPHVARLLCAAQDGIRSVDNNARFSTHIGMQPPHKDWALPFWRAMWRHGYRPDEIGLSIYPAIHGESTQNFADQKDAICALREEFGVRVMITEYGYPAGTMGTGQFADWMHPVDGYPTTDEGQAQMLEDLIVWGLENGALAGIRPFGIDFIGEPGWVDMTFFRPEGMVGVARPAIGAFERATSRVGAR